MQKENVVHVAKTVERTVEVPQIEYVDESVEVPVQRQRAVPVPVPVQRTVEALRFKMLHRGLHNHIWFLLDIYKNVYYIYELYYSKYTVYKVKQSCSRMLS